MKLAAGCSSREELKLRLAAGGIELLDWAFWLAEARESGKLDSLENVLLAPFSTKTKIFLYGSCSVGSMAVLVSGSRKLSWIWLWTVAAGSVAYAAAAGLRSGLLALADQLEQRAETRVARAAWQETKKDVASRD